MDNRTLRQRLLERYSQLKTDRTSWDTQYREITQYLLPWSGRYYTSDRNRGNKRATHIYDNTPTRALRTLASGLMAGATSPARPWFQLSTPDPELNRYHPVKIWLDDVVVRMQRVFQRSNTYRALHMIYEEIAAFGTAASVILPDLETTIHHYPVTAGEYCLAQDSQGTIKTFFREFEMTVSQVVQEFGYENCSNSVKTLYDRGTLESGIVIVQAIEPRFDRDPKKMDKMNMPYRSVYFEQACNEPTLLREGGYNKFPVLAPRWSVTGGDVYGNGPGMEALPDIRQLQHEQLRKAQGIDYQTQPPLQAPSSMQGRSVNMLPGGVTFHDAPQQNGIRSAFETQLNLSYLLEDIRDVRSRIGRSFFEDMFLMMANDTRSNTTAREIQERHEEKLLMLGPVLERLHNELLEPMIDLTFDAMLEQGMIPPPPPELGGMMLTVEFVSVLAQAQRAVGTSSVDRFLGTMGAVANMKPEVLDKINVDTLVDNYAQNLGVDPHLIISTEQAQMLRDARNKAMAAKEQAAATQQQALTAKALAQSPTGPNSNALTDVMGMFSGYNSPTASQL
jgi:hypothetical protein